MTLLARMEPAKNAIQGLGDAVRVHVAMLKRKGKLAPPAVETAVAPNFAEQIVQGIMDEHHAFLSTPLSTTLAIILAAVMLQAIVWRLLGPHGALAGATKPSRMRRAIATLR